MQYLDIKDKPIGKKCQVWKFVPNNTLEVKKGEFKARLVTRTYTLQTDRAKFTGTNETETCLLCKSSAEDTNHFLLECTALQQERERHLTVLKSYVKRNINDGILETIGNHNLMAQFILDCSSDTIRRLVHLRELTCKDIENITRTLCYSLHTKRATLLQ